ncbi:MAG: peptide deformylase [Ruminococcus sp.]|nr:peptide deformylase [Ruminococcus sp.]
MVREIVRDVLVLGRRSEPATKEDMPVVRDMLDTLAANSDRCVGMAANMIGVHKTILVAAIGGKQIAMVNPKMTDHSKEVYETEEGCLSLDGVRPVKRYQFVTVEYLDHRFKRKKQTFRGFEAQIIQHEMDHFEGKII